MKRDCHCILPWMEPTSWAVIILRLNLWNIVRRDIIVAIQLYPGNDPLRMAQCLSLRLTSTSHYANQAHLHQKQGNILAEQPFPCPIVESRHDTGWFWKKGGTYNVGIQFLWAQRLLQYWYLVAVSAIKFPLSNDNLFSNALLLVGWR